MKTTSLNNNIDSYWEFEREGDSIFGTYIETIQGGKSEVALFQTGQGTIGVNVHQALQSSVSQMGAGADYLITYTGLAKSKKSGRDYFTFQVEELEPENNQEESLLNSAKTKGIFHMSEFPKLEEALGDLPF